MLSCDYQDLLHPKQKTLEQANKFVGTVTLDGVEIDAKRSFREMYPTGPEYRMPTPIWITYHWTIFRAKSPTAKLTVSDWPSKNEPQGAVRPGADLQLSRAAAVSRMRASIARIGSSDRLKGLSTSPRISSVTAPRSGSSPGSPKMTGVCPSPCGKVM